MAQTRKDGRISEVRTIRALVSPMRQELVDTLEALGGEATVAELAGQLGKAADGLYYHLRQLVAAGLLQELEDQGEGRRYRVVTKSGKRLRLGYEPRRKGQPEALVKLVSGLLSIAKRDFAHALAAPGTVLEGPVRELWASRTKGWVGTDELSEINALLRRLTELLNQPRSDVRQQLVALAFVLAPVPAQAARRGARTSNEQAEI